MDIWSSRKRNTSMFIKLKEIMLTVTPSLKHRPSHLWRVSSIFSFCLLIFTLNILLRCSEIQVATLQNNVGKLCTSSQNRFTILHKMKIKWKYSSCHFMSVHVAVWLNVSTMPLAANRWHLIVATITSNGFQPVNVLISFERVLLNWFAIIIKVNHSHNVYSSTARLIDTAIAFNIDVCQCQFEWGNINYKGRRCNYVPVSGKEF